MGEELRPLERSERRAAFELGCEVFGSDPDDWDPQRPGPPSHRTTGAFADGRLVAKASVHALGQWFGGRRVPTGGLAGVAVALEHRERGLASRLVAASLPAMRDRGEVISTLFPATASLYRRLGWQAAGTRLRRSVATRMLERLPRPDPAVHVRRGGAGDLAGLRSAHTTVAAGQPGWIDRPDWLWQRVLHALEKDQARHLFVAERDGEVTGYLHYHRTAGDDREFFGVAVDDLVAADRATLTALLRLLASNASLNRRITYPAAPDDPLLLLLHEHCTHPEHREWRWMTRLVDAASAVAARGYPLGLRATVALDIADTAARWNAGRWVLEVAGGSAVLTPGGPGRVHVDAGTLASLYTGYANPWTLARLGLLEGASPADLVALASVFAGPSPWMPDFF